MRKFLTGFTLFLSLVVVTILPVKAEQLWVKTLETRPEWAVIASDGALLVAVEDVISRFDPNSGEVTWSCGDMVIEDRSDVQDLGNSKLILARIYPPVEDEGSRRKRRKPEDAIWSVVNLGSGETIWDLAGTPGTVVDVTPIVEANLALVFERHNPKEKEERGVYLSARNLSDGSERWRKTWADVKVKMEPTSSSSALSGLDAFPAPVLQDGKLYLAHLGIHAVDLDTGEVVWGEVFRKTPPRQMHTIAAPLVTDDQVFVGDTGVVYAYDRRTGEQQWQAKVKRSDVMPELHRTNDHLLVRFGGIFSDGKKLDDSRNFGVGALDPATGEVRWLYDDAQGGITNLLIEEDKDRVVFADALYVIGLKLSTGEILFEAPLQFYRQYGIFDAKRKGFSIAGSFAKMDPTGALSGGGGGIGGSSCSFEIGDLPLEIRPEGEQYIIRGLHHIMTFDPRVMLVQWSAIFSPTESPETTFLTTGNLPPYSFEDRSYYLTELLAGSGKRGREIMTLLGVDRITGEVTSRHDFPEVKDPVVMVDHARDRLFFMARGEKRTVNVAGYTL